MTVKKLAEELVDIDLTLEALNAQVEAIKNRRKEIVEQEMPQAMRAQQVRKKMDIDVGNRGYELALKNKIVGSLSRAPDIDKAIAYLVEKGFTGAAKADVTLKVDDENRQCVVDALKEFPGTPKVERKINHNTLAAFARECLASGEGFDLEIVGLTSLTEAQIKEVD